MNQRAHIIEIERLVLNGVNQRDAAKTQTLVEAEVRRALQGLGLPAARALAGREAAVAAEVASSVSRSLRGGTEGA